MGTEVRTTDGVPVGWTKVMKQRAGGSSAGTFDVYIFSPSGKKFRSKKQLQDHLEAGGDTGVSVEDFDFSRRSLDRSSLGEGPATPSPKPRTPKEKKKRGPKSKTLVDEEDLEESFLNDSMEVDGDQGTNPLDTSSAGTNETTETKTPVHQSSGIDISKEPSILEDYTNDDWKLILTGFFIEKNNYAETVAIRETVREFFGFFPNAKQLFDDGWIAAGDVLKPRGYEEDFVQMITRYNHEYVVNFGLADDSTKGDKKAHQLWGVTPFVACLYRILVLKDMWAPTTIGNGLMVLKKRVHKKLKAEKKLAAAAPVVDTDTGTDAAMNEDVQS